MREAREAGVAHVLVLWPEAAGSAVADFAPAEPDARPECQWVVPS